MKKHIVFFIHGVGKQLAGWSEEPLNKLKEKAATLITGQHLIPGYDVIYKDLYYADLLDNNMAALIAGGTSLGEFNDFFEQGIAERNNPDYKPETTKEKIAAALRDYALDVPCYAINPDYRQSLLVNLGLKMVGTIKQYPNASFSVVSHSLGTRVSFDLLHSLYSGTETDYYRTTPAGDPVHGSPVFNSYYQLASVSWITQMLTNSPYTPNTSYVRLNRNDLAETQHGVISKAYRIFNNMYDPVAIGGGAEKIDSNIYTAITKLDFIDRAWMHDLTAYIDHPAVHLAMIEDFYGVRFTPAFKKETIDAYNNSDKNLKHKYAPCFEKLREMFVNKPKPVNIWQFIQLIRDIKAEAKELLQCAE